jgi:hypothetical protein
MMNFVQKLKSFFIKGPQNQFSSPVLGRQALFMYALAIFILKFLFLLFVLVFPKTDFFAAINSSLLVEMINSEREERDLEPLKIDERLNTAAFMKAQDMIENDYFEHSSPSGVTPWDWFDKAGYGYVWAGENLAAHFFDTQSVFEAWMASPSHRENILNSNFKDIGVAVLSGELNGSATTISVLEFGSTPAAKIQKAAGQSATKIAENKISSVPEKKTEKGAEIKEISQPQEAEAAKEAAPEKGAVQELVQAPLATGHVQRVLGLAIFNLPEFLHSLYLYFAIFLAAALALNIFIKIRIQKPAMIGLALALIGISLMFAFF